MAKEGPTLNLSKRKDCHRLEPPTHHEFANFVKPRHLFALLMLILDSSLNGAASEGC